MTTRKSLSPQAFAITQSHLIAKEQESEVTENQLLLSSSPPTVLARAGLAILNLNVSSLRTGFGGRTVVELALDTAVTSTSTDLPEHGIRTGDIVRLSEQPKGSAKKKDVESLRSKGVEGVVTRVGERAVWVAIGKQGIDSDDEEVPDGKLWLVKLANDVTYKRINQTLTKLSKMSESNYSSLVRVLLGLSSPGSPDLARLGDLNFINPTINESQKTAIKHALSAPELSLIHGPPGTGKTATVIELIVQFLLAKPELRILVCGPSNISVDNIVERLSLLPSSLPTSSADGPQNGHLHSRYKKPTFTRLGHPARLLPNILTHSLEFQTRTSESAAIVKDVLSEMEAKQSSIRKTRSGRERRQIYTDLKDLRKEYRTREAKCVSEVIRTSQVVCCTLHGAGSRQLFQQSFDVVIIDEASQALEAQCWIPLLSVIGVSKLILAGDHLQLPPTIKSSNDKIDKKTKAKNKAELETELKKLSISDDELKTAHKTTLEDTMFSRLLDTHGPEIKTLLTIQYRMHELISRFPSQELYDSKLVPDPSIATHLLSDLPNITSTDDTTSPLIFIDTQGGNFPEIDTSTSDDPKHSLLNIDSKSNPSEPPLILTHLHSLITTSHLSPSSIAVITPYASQLSLLSALIRPLFPQVELGTVDGFQGREKEVVILSLVRSNEKGEVGFLKDVRRLNVAMTRARRCLVVVGDGETVGREGGFLKRWMEYLDENADVRYPEMVG